MLLRKWDVLIYLNSKVFSKSGEKNKSMFSHRDLPMNYSKLKHDWHWIYFSLPVSWKNNQSCNL